MTLFRLLAGGLLLATLLFAGCEVLQPSYQNADSYTKRVSYHRGSCFGRCPVYTLDLYENGLLVYQGERFTDKEGTWQRTIDRRRAQALIDSFERVGFAEFPRAFRSTIADASVIDMTYTAADGTTYATSYSDYAPEPLMELDRAMRRLADLEGYRYYSDTLAPTFAPPRNVPDKLDQIVVLLKEGVSPQAWIVKYGKQSARLVERVAPSSDYWVIEASNSVMTIDELVEIMRADEEVVSAQTNKRTLPR